MVIQRIISQQANGYLPTHLIKGLLERGADAQPCWQHHACLQGSSHSIRVSGYSLRLQIHTLDGTGRQAWLECLDQGCCCNTGLMLVSYHLRPGKDPRDGAQHLDAAACLPARWAAADVEVDELLLRRRGAEVADEARMFVDDLVCQAFIAVGVEGCTRAADLSATSTKRPSGLFLC